MDTPEENSEVIDLTGPSPTPRRQFVDLTLGDDTPDDPTLLSPVKRKSHRRRKKESSNGVNSQTSIADTTRPPSTEATLQDPSEKHNGAYASQPSSPQPSPRRPSPSSKSETSQLFYVDTSPVINLPLADVLEKPQELEQQSAAPTSTLLLPAHVHILGSEQLSMPAPSQKELDEEDYIEYLDYDDHKDIPRYFEELSKVDTKPSRLVCKRCGAEGDHKTSACTITVCLTCGVHNEHSTRSCPINKVCFACGMKGHINQTCPNRYVARGRDFNKYSECERCQSTLHQTNECPSWWRLYEYVTDEEKVRMVEFREQKKPPLSSNGGHGCISDEPWCYNCGDIGHWGDDCDEVPHRDDRPEEPSAFSLHNIRSGPFYHPENESSMPAKQARRYNKRKDDYPTYDDWPKDIPGEVGLQGRKKNMARLEKRAREQEKDDDDWFGRPADLRIRGEARRETMAGNDSRRQSKMSFGKSVSDAGKRFGFENSKSPSLLSRLSNDNRSGDVRSRGSHGRNDDGDRWNGGSRRERDREYDRNRDRDRDRNRPRYKGGYTR